MSTAPTLDLRAPLPAGRVVIEASAGTGKTFAVAGIVTRLIVEHDCPVDAVLVTTFTRAAAAELRSRIRERLSSAITLLEGQRSPSDDVIDQALWLAAESATGGPATLAARARRALTDFDAASITTIHGLCQRLLRLAGRDVAIDAEASAGQDVVREAVNDLIVAEALRPKHDRIVDLPSADRLESFMATAVGNPTAELWIEDSADAALAQMLDRISTCRNQIWQREAARLTYNGLLREAHARVTDPQADDLRAQIREQFRVGIVDEAQDTDPLQWQLLQALFPLDDAERSLFIVGDPKQSIYAFRGADVEGYVDSRSQGAEMFTLRRNFRSDQRLLDGLNGLFAGARFGHGVDYIAVVAPPERPASALPEGEPAVDLIVLGDPAQGERLATQCAAAAADEVFRMQGELGVPAGDIAVLVGWHSEADAIAARLERRGVRTVTAGSGSVAATEAAEQLRDLLRAVERPQDERRVRRMAIGWFGSLQEADLISGDEQVLNATQSRLADFARELRQRGTAALLRAMLDATGTLDRMALDRQLARHLTDLTHLGELLFERTGGRGCTPAEALGALTDLTRIEDTNELVVRRIASDAAAVKILTIHAAKGLQFGHVVVAKNWSPVKLTNKVPMGRFGPPSGGELPRRIDCGHLISRTADDALVTVQQAAEDEEDRLFYVALTRAKHRLSVVLPTGAEAAADDGTPAAFVAPTRCFGLVADGGLQHLEQVSKALEPRVAALNGAVRVRASQPRPEAADGEHDANHDANRDASSSLAHEPLQLAAQLQQAVTAPRRRWSFTALTSARAGSRHEPVATDDLSAADDEFAAADEFVSGGEPTTTGPTGTGTAATGTGATGVLSTLPAGADFGTMLHSVLEHTDFAAPELEVELRRHVERFANTTKTRHRHGPLIEGLAAMLRTPLSTSAPLDFTLADIPRSQRLDELRFDFSLAHLGDPHPTITAIGRLLVEHLSGDDPLRAYAQRLAEGLLTTSFSGMLNGFVDLIVRLPADPQRLLIVDYKSNRLPSYDAASMLSGMVHHHYPLQGLLYSVALFRWLRWRLGEPDPSHRLAGFAYLFVRGMVGPLTPEDSAGRVDGVFHWRPPHGLIPALSDLLSGVERQAGGS